MWRVRKNRETLNFCSAYGVSKALNSPRITCKQCQIILLYQEADSICRVQAVVQDSLREMIVQESQTEMFCIFFRKIQ